MDKNILYAKEEGKPASVRIPEGDSSTEYDKECILLAEVIEKIENEGTISFVIRFRLGIETTGISDYSVHRIKPKDEETNPDGPNYEDTTISVEDVYYGIVGTEYGQKMQEVLLNIETITNGEGMNVTITPKEFNSEVMNQQKLQDLMNEFEKILERIPINLKFIYEVAGILDKIAAFEANRVPYINTNEDGNTTKENSGFEKSDDINVGIINGDSYELRNGITVQKDGDKDLYQFKPEGSHAKLVEELQNIVLYCNSFCNSESEEQLYNAATQFVSKWKEYYKGQEPDNSTDITVDIINNAEFEIYEEEAIYKVFVASTKEGDVNVVESLTSNGEEPNGQNDPLIDFLTIVLEQMKPEIKQIMGYSEEGEVYYTLRDATAYIDPETQPGVSGEVLENKLLEYRGMYSTIQGARNALQRTGDTDSFILKFLQTDKGTYFELLGQEPANTDSRVTNDNIYAYYVAKGYQANVPDDQDKKNIVPPRGRDRHYSRRSTKKVEKNVTAIPEQSTNEWRLVKIPKFYSEEPLDWIADNYYSNFIYDQNAYNLSIIIDPEFAARNKVIYTKVDNENKEPKEQNMIGYYLVDCSSSKPSDDQPEP